LRAGREPDRRDRRSHGDERILYASDLPHAHRVFDAIKIFDRRKDIKEQTKAKILSENGPRFFGL